MNQMSMGILLAKLLLDTWLSASYCETGFSHEICEECRLVQDVDYLVKAIHLPSEFRLRPCTHNNGCMGNGLEYERDSSADLDVDVIG